MTVYFLDCQYSYWGWHDVLLELALHVVEKYGAKFEYQKGGHLVIEKFDNYRLPDSEILIHDEVNDRLYGLHWGETRTGMMDIFEKRNNPNDILLVTQFYNIYQRNFDRSTWNFKIKNTVYYPFVPQANHEYYYRQRKIIEMTKPETIIDKVFCLFTTIRPIGLQLREAGLVTEATNFMNIHDYLNLAINYKMGLALSGVAEVNFREIEYMAVGIPMLRMEYMTQLDPPLIPNYHYIAVSREGFPWDMYAERNGGPEYVEAYIKRYNEVKDDKELLSFVAKNAKEYYQAYCSPENRLKHLLTQIEL